MKELKNYQKHIQFKLNTLGIILHELGHSMVYNTIWFKVSHLLRSNDIPRIKNENKKVDNLQNRHMKS